MNVKSITWCLVALSTVLMACASTPAYAKPHTAQSADPAGNNGFVKVNEEETPDDTPQNDPHVSCTFNLEFYNYDQGDNYADVSFELQNPTSGAGYSLTVNSGNLHPFIGGDAAGGGNDLDAFETYTLGFTGTPHTQQGYHVKLTIHADGSQGSDVKHKTFWVKPCQEPQAPGTPTCPAKTPHQPPITPVPPIVTPGKGSVVPLTPTPQPVVPSATATPAATTPALPAELPHTGANPLTGLWISLAAAAIAYAVAYVTQGRFVKNQA